MFDFTPVMMWHLTHSAFRFSTPHFVSNQRANLFVEKPVESAANFVSMIRSGRLDRIISSFKVFVVFGSSRVFAIEL